MSDDKRGRGRTFVRFSLAQRIEHTVTTVGFIGLCVTGIPQKYNGAAWADAAIQGMGGIELVRVMHRACGATLVAQCFYHFGALVYNLAVRRVRWTMWPGLQDLRDAGQMVLFFLGRRPTRARFDRYDFRQKVEYLALIWGTLVMVFSGLCMWFPVQVTSVLPGELIPAAKAAHSGEGMLALGSILLWHMYSAHLSPDVFPMDMTIFTGKISEERIKHEHPIEYERIIAAEEAAERARVEAAERERVAAAERARAEAPAPPAGKSA